MSRKWVKLIESTGREHIAEDNEDGSYTVWAFSIWGPIGTRGVPLPVVKIFPIKTRKDRERVDVIEKGFARSLESQNALFTLEKMRRDGWK